MGQDNQPSQPEQTDFFVSYVSSNQDWAEWLGTQLEQAGYTVFVEAWDVRPGDNRVLALNQGLQRAERVLVVLSPAYFQMEMVQTQWAAALLKDQTGTHRRVLPVLIETCDVDGLLRGLVCIDLVSVDEQAARTRLLAGLQTERTRPASVAFPARRGTGAAFPGKSLMWMMPFARNPYFTGREEQLQVLREQLQARHSAAIGQIQAITGLGGIGKTQMAVEYAYRHREEYAQVFWVRADTMETLASSYGEMARLLDLPERNAQEQAVMIQAVNIWLREHRDYLLILDNADDPALLPPFLPPDPAGHVLITTRAADLSKLDLGLADPFALDVLPPEQGVSFLLHRAGVLAQTTEEERSLALQLVEELGGLPLALDQAGAYLRKTRSSLAGYRHLYRQQHARLLKEHHSRNYPASVATTWTLSFQRVEQQNPAAADLLRFCAFLAPDAIPEAILTQGAPELGSVLASVAADPLQLNDAIAVLRAYSLLERDAQDGALSIHRLVQTVLRDSLPTRKQKQWMRRAVLAVEAAHPGWSFDAWPALERWLPHAQICAA